MLSFASDYTEGACEEILQKLEEKNTGGDRMPGGGGLFSGGRYPDECGRDQQHSCTV